MTQDVKSELPNKSEIVSQERDVRLKTSIDDSNAIFTEPAKPAEPAELAEPADISSSSSTSSLIHQVHRVSPSFKKRLLCLYCDRIFVSSNLRQKHVERCHSVNQLRRSSARTPGRTSKLPPSCMFCPTQVKNIDLKKLFEHLVYEHSNKYWGCVSCQERFGNKEQLKSHNERVHEGLELEVPKEEKRLKKRVKKDDNLEDFEDTIVVNVISQAELLKEKEEKDFQDKIELEKQSKSKRKVKKERITRKSVKSKPKSNKTLLISTQDASEEPVKEEIPEVTPPVTNFEFDANFFNCVSFNIQDNLLHHLDGKVHTNIEPIPIKLSPENPPLSLNPALTAITPVASLLKSQNGIDAYRQIEYGSKAPKLLTRKHYVKYNFRSRKQKQGELQKDISKLDMWTQIAMKTRQQKVKSTPEELQIEELNRILDTRGPFQDLHEEALSSRTEQTPETEIKTILEDILTKVFTKINDTPIENPTDRLKPPKIKTEDTNRITRSRYRNESTTLDETETLSYFNLFPTPKPTTKPPLEHNLGLNTKQLDRYLSENDHETIISSSVELSGEWARPRIYVCGACGLKIPNLKLLEDHKTFIHPHVWCVHYEFVGNQSEFYPHLNIPGLGRILENEKKEDVRNWEKSSARVCSKCKKQCNSLGDLHRHMLECGGDWQWMLAKKKCKYRPCGGTRFRRKKMMGEL